MVSSSTSLLKVQVFISFKEDFLPFLEWVTCASECVPDEKVNSTTLTFFVKYFNRNHCTTNLLNFVSEVPFISALLMQRNHKSPKAGPRGKSRAVWSWWGKVCTKHPPHSTRGVLGHGQMRRWQRRRCYSNVPLLQLLLAAAIVLFSWM